MEKMSGGNSEELDMAVCKLLKSILDRRSQKGGAEDDALESPWMDDSEPEADTPPPEGAKKIAPPKKGVPPPKKEEEHPMDKYARDGRRRRL